VAGRRLGLVVGSTWVTSTLCHSLLRVEPYSSCPFACSYCYARWYGWGPGSAVESMPKVVAAFERVARFLRKRGLKPIPLQAGDPHRPLPASGSRG
jgi:DNA repair photolyase